MVDFKRYCLCWILIEVFFLYNNDVVKIEMGINDIEVFEKSFENNRNVLILEESILFN